MNSSYPGYVMLGGYRKGWQKTTVYELLSLNRIQAIPKDTDGDVAWFWIKENQVNDARRALKRSAVDCYQQEEQCV
jgi:hypothetical protein